MTYNFLFNLHIPKTGGTHFNNNLLPLIEPYLEQNNITINPNDTLHWSWYEPFINDNTYIYTSLRDPVKRLISQYAWQAYDAILNNCTSYTEEDITKENFYKWVYENEDIYKNVQAKSLTFYDSNAIYGKATNLRWGQGDVPRRDHYLFSESFINFKIDQNKLLENIKRINLVVRFEELVNRDNQLNIMNKILKDLNISDKALSLVDDELIFINPFSKKLYLEFNQAEKESLYRYQDIDTELYFSDVYTKY